VANQRNSTFRQRLRYRVDNLFAKGALPVLLALCIGLLIPFLIAGLVITLFSWGPEDQPVSFLEGFWLSLTRSLDPGTFGGDEGPHFRIIGLIVSLTGLVALATLIGIISSAIDSRMERLKSGRSLVIEEGHTLILGWSPKVPPIVAELVLANESERDAAVVLLTPLSVTEVEREVRAHVPDLKTTRLIVRTGDHGNLNDLERVNPAGAKSIIVVAEDSESNADSATVKSVLGVIRLTGVDGPPLVVEIRDRAIADALKVAAGDRTRVLVPSDIVGRVAAQVTRTPGLSIVYQELLDFSGDEIYMTLECYDATTIIGLQHSDGTIELNPPMSRIVLEHDDLIVIAEDDSLVGTPKAASSWDGSAYHPLDGDPKSIEHTLIIGWSHYAPVIAREIDESVAQGSTLDILFDPILAPGVSYESLQLTNQEVRLIRADSLDLRKLHDVLGSSDYEHVLSLCYRDSLPPTDADARALLTLMAVRNHPSAEHINLVTEVMMPDDAGLAEVAQPDDSVVSERLMSLAMAQISENPALSAVFRALLDNDDVSVALRPWSCYSSDHTSDFSTVIGAARDRGETAIGWTCAALVGHPRDLGGGVFINPPKNLQAAFGDGDRVIVLA